ncbi:hypothetical protein DFJ43DRAFT_5286 [Lentinula guzmanii]|uniref:Secreted protein n=1 Tax=Lentinula guzmanii TaxID=2804957 RepID=A0AA38JKE8_9AGAR|nr:hypothetical protein DFJ43DRAFT_5286 [Lentinula guzmanii]
MHFFVLLPVTALLFEHLTLLVLNSWKDRLCLRSDPFKLIPKEILPLNNAPSCPEESKRKGLIDVSTYCHVRIRGK